MIHSIVRTIALVIGLTLICHPTLAASIKPVIKITAQPTTKIELSAATPSQQISVTASINTSDTLTYQWFKDKATIAGATSSSYTVTAAGTYTVTVSASGAKSVTSKKSTVTFSLSPVTLSVGDVITTNGTYQEKGKDSVDGSYTDSGTENELFAIQDVTNKIITVSDNQGGYYDVSYTYTRTSLTKGTLKLKHTSTTESDNATISLIFTSTTSGTYTSTYSGTYDYTGNGGGKGSYSGKAKGNFVVTKTN